MTLISEVLPAPFGPDQGDELALFDAEADVVDRPRFAEVAFEIDRLEERPCQRLLSLAVRRSIVPTIPVGSTITSTTSTPPSTSCQ